MRRLFSRSAYFGFLALACLAVAQQRPMGRYQIAVTPDHANWQYALGEKATFNIHVQQSDGSPATGANLTWTLGPDNMPPVRTQTAPIGAADLKVDAGTLKEPGFLRLVASVPDPPPAAGAAGPAPGGRGGFGGRGSRGMATVGFAPLQIKPVTKEPEGFDKFWDDSKAILARIPINPQKTPYADKTTATLSAYEVSFAVPNGDMAPLGSSRIYGILTEPKAEGKYPALLRVPGAGVYGVSGIVKEAYEDAITLSIGINGIPLTLPGPVYNSLMSGALSSYNRYNIDSKEKYYFRRVYLGCVRAIDYLASLPNWDGKTVAVIGASQGGALSIITAGLDPRVKAIAVFHPALSDVTGYLFGRAGGWPDLFRGPENRTPDKIETEAFYDTVNFARRVKVPGIYSWGYNDETCAPTSTYAAYNTVQAPKTLFLALESGHNVTPPQDQKVAAWMKEFLKTGKAPAE